jgi:exopolysaccharide production protein ExoQ
MNPRREPAAGPGVGERLFAAFVLLMVTGAFTNLMGSEETAQENGVAGSIIMQTVWSVIYLTTFILLLRRCRGFLSVIRREKLLSLLVALTMISVSWSDDPALTFRRSVALIGTTLFGVYFANRFRLADQLRLLSRVFVFAAILSLIFVAILPKYGMMKAEFDHAWQGIYGHKNALGEGMALAIVVFAFRISLAPREAMRWWVAIALAFLLLVKSNSYTSVVACLLSLSVFALSRLLRWNLKRAIPILLVIAGVGVAAGLWVVSHLESVLSASGKDPSLTGRTTIWMVSIVYIVKRPWLGYGYNEFWPGTGADIVTRFTHGFIASHAHNAILNLWLDVGLVGVIVFVLQYLRSLWRAADMVRHTRTVEGLWPLVFLFFLAIQGVAESVILQRNSLAWMLFTSVVLVVSSDRVVLRARPALSFAPKPAG